MDVLQRDISGFNANMGHLSKLSRGLIERGHFDSPNIQNKMAAIEREFEMLKQLLDERSQRLENDRRVHKFLREADEVGDWISEQMAVAASEDYGRDVEHVEILIQKFESFLSTLNASHDRIESLKTTAKNLLDELDVDPNKISSKIDDVNQLWDDLNELAHARQDALSGAKLVHVFDRDADETVAWISEKEAALYSEDYGEDLETVHALIRKHAGFEHDLAAVKEQVSWFTVATFIVYCNFHFVSVQVDSVVKEALRLADRFPDAREHISVRHEETICAWEDLLKKAAQRKDKLQQADVLQAYFDDYRDLM